jgi:exodeoxyribonuclease III
MAKRQHSLSEQQELFAPEPRPPSRLPDGFGYCEELISPGEERALVRDFAALPFQPFEFHGYLGKRRIVSFGWRYDYAGRTLRDSPALPSFLLTLREQAAAFAALPPDGLQQVLVTEYAAGAGIGWHRDKPMFQDVVAVSFLSPCTLRFRRRDGAGWERAAHGGFPLGLCAARPGALGMAAQHSPRRSLALFGDVPEFRRRQRRDGAMKIATYNVNGVNGRLPNLLTWLEEAAPDIVCLQELKAPDERFPAAAIRDAGYGAIWNGQKSWNGVAILAHGAQPAEIRRFLPDDPDDTHSRYIEAAVDGLTVGCLYLPNGNPAPGPKFDYKLRWFERFATHAKALLASGAPVVLAGDYNVMPTELAVYAPERWVDDALFRPEVRAAYRRLLAQGWTDAVRALHPGERIYTFWDYWRNAFARNAGLRIDHLLLSPDLTQLLVAAGVDRDARGRERASDHAPTWIELAPAKGATRRKR